MLTPDDAVAYLAHLYDKGQLVPESVVAYYDRFDHNDQRVASDLARQLLAAREALRALSLDPMSDAACGSVHHAKKDRHEWAEPCPVILRARACLPEHQPDAAEGGE